MVAREHLTELVFCHLLFHLVFPSELPHSSLEDSEQLPLRYAAYSLILRVIADVCRLFETAEHTVVRQRRLARDKYKLQVLVVQLQEVVESLQSLTVVVSQRLNIPIDDRSGNVPAYHVS